MAKHSRHLPASLPHSRRSTAHATSACTRHSCRLRISMHTSKVGGACIKERIKRGVEGAPLTAANALQTTLHQHATYIT